MKEDPVSRMHTAEHLLNLTMVRMFDCGRCVSEHLNRKKSKWTTPLNAIPFSQERESG
ncbi:MAG: hypothetical protein K9K64_16220 [Desulfohalobiaceae bacterium]|nr:hypothetical protein [Desulfohalobiaceae bacterium]